MNEIIKNNKTEILEMKNTMNNFFLVGFELRALHLLGRHSTTGATPPVQGMEI
jgi:hypothetical protein